MMHAGGRRRTSADARTVSSERVFDFPFVRSMLLPSALVLLVVVSFGAAFVPIANPPFPRGSGRGGKGGSTRSRGHAADGADAGAPPSPAGRKPSPRDLERAFSETMWKMRVLQDHSDDFLPTRPEALRDLFRRCETSVRADRSTVPAAGTGLFANRDASAGSILTFYPVHALGANFKDGSCYLQSKEGHDHVSSVYVLSLVGDRPIWGIDLKGDFGGTGFVDADPRREAGPAFQCHRINDGAVVSENAPESVMEYYAESLERQNAVFLPFGPAPLIAAMATKDIKEGEEVFTCYGRGYWLGAVERDRGRWSERTEEIALVEKKVAEALKACSDHLEREYAREESELYQAFDDIA